MYKIIFTLNGEVTQVMTGYCSRSEAMVNIRDMDHMIPLSWDYTIEKA